jgi:hypothetical protein
MYCDSNSVAECVDCDERGLDVTETRVDGEVVTLCPGCNRERMLGGST